MMATRRDVLRSGGAIAALGAALSLTRDAAAQDAHAGHAARATGAAHQTSASDGGGGSTSARTQPPSVPDDGSYRPVVTLNGGSLPWRLKDGVKEFRLVAEPVKREFAP